MIDTFPVLILIHFTNIFPTKKYLELFSKKYLRSILVALSLSQGSQLQASRIMSNSKMISNPQESIPDVKSKYVVIKDQVTSIDLNDDQWSTEVRLFVFVIY